MANHLGPDLNVFNQLTHAMVAIVESLPLEKLARLVLAAKRKDPSRGNQFIDVGFASDRNSTRGAEFGGVSVPRCLDGSELPIYKKAMKAMTKLSDITCQEEMIGKAFVDKERNALFAGKNNPGNRIEALRVALSNATHLVACHADDKNDVLENFRGVVNYSKWLFLEGQWWRLSIIGYSRKSIGGCIRRRDLYMPLVERITLYYRQMPEERKLISKDLLDFRLVPPGQQAKRLKPHANKCVYYSIFVWCLSKLTAKLHLSRWHVLALMTNTIISESPEFFYQTTEQILKCSESSMARYRTLCPVDLAFEFYEIVFNEKSRRSNAGLSVPGQRHQPHYNRRQDKQVVKRSVENLFALYRAFEHIDTRLASDPHYYGKAVAFLAASDHDTGVFGAGGLLCQHLIHIGVLCGFFPKGMLKHAVIGEETNSYKYLRRWEGLSDHMEDTRQLLACVSTTLGLPHSVVENVVCKFGQDQTEEPPIPKHVPNPPNPGDGTKARDTTTMKKSRKDRSNAADTERVWKKRNNPYKDSVYRGQSLYDIDKEERLVKTTKSGSTFVEPLACRCLKFEHESGSQAFFPTVAYSYWEKKPKGRRVIPMTAGTAKYLKKVKAAADNGTHEITKVVPKERTNVAKRTTRKKERTTVAKSTTRKKVAAVLCDYDRDNDDEDNTDEDDEDYADCGGVGEGQFGKRRSVPRKCRQDIELLPTVVAVVNNPVSVSKRKRGTAKVVVATDQVLVPKKKRRTTEATHDGGFVQDVETAGQTTKAHLLKPQFPSSETVMAVQPECRFYVSIRKLAMKALAIPQFHKHFLQFGNCHHQPSIGRGYTMVTASLLPSPDESPWLPPPHIGSGFSAALFPGSFVKQDGRRYHMNKALAARYLFMAAMLNGRVNPLDDLVALRNPYVANQGLAVVVDDAGSRKDAPPRYGPPLAAIARQPDGSWTFSFVDVRGLSVGNLLSTSSSL
jgi:hypothetical protein